MGGQGRDTVIHQGLVHDSQKVGAQPSFRVKNCGSVDQIFAETRPV